MLTRRRASQIAARVLCGCIFLLPLNVCAQETPAPEILKAATLVTADGDSLRGQIELPSWSPTPQTIRFRRHAQDPFVTYRTSELRFVHPDHEPRLVQRAVILDQVPTDPQKATRFLQSNRPTTKLDTLLLERRVQGPMRFYIWRGDRIRYFVESDGDITELVKHEHFLAAQRRVFTDFRYRRQLAARMRACPTLQDDVEDVDLQLRPLVELVVAYNRCVTGDDKATFAVEGESPYTTAFGPVAGISRSTLFAQGTLGAVTAPGRSYVFDWMTGYMLGIWGTVRQAGQGRPWGLYGQVTGFKQAFDGYTEEREGALRYKEVRIERTSLYLSALVRYYMTTFDWQPYVEAGMSSDYAVRFVNQQRLFQQVGDEEPILIFQRPALRDFQRFSFGVVAGTGVAAGRWSLGVRAEYTSGFSGRSGLSTRALHTYAVVAFHL